MFNHISNYIDIQLLENVESISDDTATLTDGYSWDRLECQDTPSWSEKPSVSDSGYQYTQTLSFVT